MRQIILDTETTGLEVQRGHRVIEIGIGQHEQRRLASQFQKAGLQMPRRDLRHDAADAGGPGEVDTADGRMAGFLR